MIASFDLTDPPVDPPPECRHRMAWLLARQLWAAHQPGPDGRCQVPGAWRPPWHRLLPRGR